MDRKQLIEETRRLISRAGDTETINGVYAEVCEFFRKYAGAKSEFLAAVKEYNPARCNEDYASKNIRRIVISFERYVSRGLQEEITPERQAQLDVVSDFLGQAQRLLAGSGVHPAAPAVLIGAALEEFLRTWVESAGITARGRNLGLDAYGKALREGELITRQDVKDITAWAGLRNHAAHGEWDQVADKSRIALMLEGVNLFMRKYERC